MSSLYILANLCVRLLFAVWNHSFKFWGYIFTAHDRTGKSHQLEWGLGILDTQNSKEIRLPDTHTHCAHKATVNVKHAREVECALRGQNLGAPGEIPKDERTEA